MAIPVSGATEEDVDRIIRRTELAFALVQSAIKELLSDLAINVPITRQAVVLEAMGTALDELEDIEYDLIANIRAVGKTLERT